VSAHLLGFGLPDSSAAPRLPPIARLEANAHARACAHEHEVTAAAGCPQDLGYSNLENKAKSGRKGQSADVLAGVAVDRLPGHGLLPRLRVLRSAMRAAVLQLTSECRTASELLSQLRPSAGTLHRDDGISEVSLSSNFSSNTPSGISIFTKRSDTSSGDKMRSSHTTSDSVSNGAPILQELSAVTQTWELSAANLFNAVAERGYTALVDYCTTCSPPSRYPDACSRREHSQDQLQTLLLRRLVACSDAATAAAQRFTEVQQGLGTAANAALRLGPDAPPMLSAPAAPGRQIDVDDSAEEKGDINNSSRGHEQQEKLHPLQQQQKQHHHHQEHGRQSSQAASRAEAAASAAQAVGALRLHYDRISLLLYRAHAALDLVANPKPSDNFNQYPVSGLSQEAIHDDNNDDGDTKSRDDAVASVEACALALSSAAAALLASPLVEQHLEANNLQSQPKTPTTHGNSAMHAENTPAAAGTATLGLAWEEAIARVEVASAVCRGDFFSRPTPESSQLTPTEDPPNGLVTPPTPRNTHLSRVRLDGGAGEEGRYGLWAGGEGFRSGSSAGANHEVDEEVEEVITAVGGWTAADEQEMSASSMEGTSSNDDNNFDGDSGDGRSSSLHDRRGPQRGPELRAALSLELSSALAARQRPWPVRAREVNGAYSEEEQSKSGLRAEATATVASAVACAKARDGDGACERSNADKDDVEAESTVPWARKKATKRRQGPPKPCPPIAEVAPLQPQPSSPLSPSLPLDKCGNASAMRGGAALGEMLRANATNRRRPLLADLVRGSLAATTARSNDEYTNPGSSEVESGYVVEAQPQGNFITPQL